MLTVPSFFRVRHPTRLACRSQRPNALVEALEGRVLPTFNGYIAGLASGAGNQPASFVFSTTGQAAKHWDINWGDGSPIEPQDAPNQTTGWTSPVTFTHPFAGGQVYAVTGTATSTTNVTAAAVLQENSAWTGETNGAAGVAGKTVDGLVDGASVFTNNPAVNIASVVDQENRSYV